MQLACPLVSCWNVKQERERELRLNQFNLNERSGLACFSLGLWKLCGVRRDTETGKRPVFQENEILFIYY